MLSEFCIQPATKEQVQVNRFILSGALHVALSQEVWPRKPETVRSATLIRGVTLNDIIGPWGTNSPDETAVGLAQDDGFATMMFHRYEDDEYLDKDIIQRDLFQAAVLSCLRNLQPLTQGVEFFAIQRMAQAASSIIGQDVNYDLSAQLLRDWIFIAAFGSEATGVEAE